MTTPQVTLCYIVQNGRVLLIHKKRGIGAGKVNGPGGKVEPDEDPLAAAIRETREETGLTPLSLELRGELWFDFDAGQASQCFIYHAVGCEGAARETAEAIPEWYDVASLPYGEMWEDDRHWLPILLRGERFRGEVEIRGDKARIRSLAIIN